MSLLLNYQRTRWWGCEGIQHQSRRAEVIERTLDVRNKTEKKRKTKIFACQLALASLFYSLQNYLLSLISSCKMKYLRPNNMDKFVKLIYFNITVFLNYSLPFFIYPRPMSDHVLWGYIPCLTLYMLCVFSNIQLIDTLWIWLDYGLI